MTVITADELGRLQLLVDSLGYDLEPSILIGGWATKLRIGGEASKDIDLIINDLGLRSKLRNELTDYSENTHHSGGLKGRGTVKGVHVDTYIPYESQLGDKLRLKVEELSKYVEPERVQGWLMLTIDAHIATKFAALLDRPDSEKGAKDAREIVGLFKHNPTASGVIDVLRTATAANPADIASYVSDVFELLPDRAKLNKKERRELANMRRAWVEEALRQSSHASDEFEVPRAPIFAGQARKPKG